MCEESAALLGRAMALSRKNKKCLEESLGQKEAAGIFPTRTAVTCPKIVFFTKNMQKMIIFVAISSGFL